MKYTVLSAIYHDQQAYPEGAEITLTPEEAEPLLLLHVIQRIPTKSAKEAN